MNNLEKLAIVKFFNFEDYAYGKFTVKNGVLYRLDTPIAVHMGGFIYVNATNHSKAMVSVREKVENFKSNPTYRVKQLWEDELVKFIK
jgi:hypothetical protein